jgi:DnaJ-class molecular chaperone
MITDYDVIGVSRYATKEEIKKAYRAKVKKHHPDTGDGNLDKTRELITAYKSIMKNIDNPDYSKQDSQEPFNAYAYTSSTEYNVNMTKEEMEEYVRRMEREMRRMEREMEQRRHDVGGYRFDCSGSGFW